MHPLPDTSHQQRWRQLALAALIAGLLFSIYLLTYSGVPNTGDERVILDTTNSLAVHGHLQLNQTGYLRQVQTSDVEPAQPVLSVPLYWLAYQLPRVGNVHAMFLFSPLMTALTVALFFLYARDLGYGERTALVGALLLGTTTILWPYTKTYFREPLTTLNLFLAIFLWRRWRVTFEAASRRQWVYLAGAILATLVALFSKEAILIALPVLILIALPHVSALKAHRQRLLIIGIGLALAAVFFVGAVLLFREQFHALATRYAVLTRLERFVVGLPMAGEGLLGYLVSPGKGIWWYSPVLLLIFSAPALLPRHRWRESWLPLGTLLLFALTYAAVRGVQWAGGTGWGSRYMVPIVPFLMIAALPAVDAAFTQRNRRAQIAVGGLALIGLAVQIAGSYVYIFDYERHLIESTGQVPYGDIAVWSVRWSQAVGSLLYIGQAATDIRWLIAGVDWLIIGAIGALIAVGGGGLVWLHRQPRHRERSAWLVLAAVPILTVGVSGLALRRAYVDPRYLGGNEALSELRATLEADVRPDDTILLSSPSYADHFMNYYKGQAIYYTMPLSPGERYSEHQEPAVVSDQVEELIATESEMLIGSVSIYGTFYRASPVWLVQDLSPQLPFTTRPVEWYMAKYNFMVAAHDFSERVRLVQYVPFFSPPADVAPAYPLDVRFGESMQLVGYDLVVSEEVGQPEHLQPGDMLGVSLLWEAVTPPADNYTTAMFLIGPEGLPVLQQDTQPMGGFAPTGSWQPGEHIRDNVGFVLPADLPPGTYEIWSVVYSWPSLERLPVYDPDGTLIGDHMVLHTLTIP